MKSSLLRLCLSSTLLCLALAASASAQDFQRSYRLGAGDTISLRNVSGDVLLTGYDGDAVTVTGIKEGRDRELVEIEDRSTNNRVDLRVRYPQNCNCQAGVRFEVRVPRSVRYTFDPISTASGNISVKGVTGRLNVNTASGDVLVEDAHGSIKASTASGDVRVSEVTGDVNANSASGDVNVQLARLEGIESMEFSSASGDVNVRVPADIDAEVSLSSATGSVQTNFPIEVKKQEHGPGSNAHARLGSGSRRLSASSASGDVSLTSN